MPIGAFKLNAISKLLSSSGGVGSFVLSKVLDNANAYSTSQSDAFAFSVDISDNYAIVGAYTEDDAGGTDSGKAYIYSTSTGSLLYTLNNPNAYSTSPGDNFGRSVAISNNYAIVGASAEDDAGGLNSGKAYIYSTSTGSLVYTLDNPNAYSTSAGDNFGFSVSISNNYAIVGAYNEDDAGGTSSGKAYIYSTSTGSLLYTLDNPNAYSTSASDFFAYTVAISNNYAIVGAWQEDDASGTSSGKAYIYSTSNGSLLYTLNNPNPYSTSANDTFGFWVDISDNYAIVGAPGEDEASGNNSGKAYIYSTSSGSLLYTLSNPNAYSTVTNDQFGVSVAISNNYAIVGAYTENDAGGITSGKAYIYSTSSGSLLYTLDNPNAYGTSDSDSFARFLGISDNYAIVGAPGEDDPDYTSSGKAYLYSNVLGASVFPVVSISSSTTSITSTITIPSTAIVGDYVLLFDTSTTVTDTIPTGFTSINGVTTTGIRTNISYKKLVSGDPGSTITGMAGTTRKVLFVLRPNFSVSSLTVGTVNSQATTAAPTNQTLNMTSSGYPSFGFAVFASTGTPTTRDLGVLNEVEVSSVSTSGIYVQAINFQTTNGSSYTVAMSDGGTNTLQSFYIKFNS